MSLRFCWLNFIARCLWRPHYMCGCKRLRPKVQGCRWHSMRYQVSLMFGCCIGGSGLVACFRMFCGPSNRAKCCESWVFFVISSLEAKCCDVQFRGCGSSYVHFSGWFPSSSSSASILLRPLAISSIIVLCFIFVIFTAITSNSITNP